ncbi:hypothetical protein PBY51_010035 [Eleginops maclovinus]|uniref:Uncharacterized protein n=1 Tax=Eleginops maclovinus TaxID=56733 RepID=A0AAN7XV84_ELEMC|nr:hypothetical protein PBY51_010035 [Eleginops maclovinus]
MSCTSGPYLQSADLPLGEFVGCGAPGAESPQVGEGRRPSVLVPAAESQLPPALCCGPACLLSRSRCPFVHIGATRVE